MIACYDLAVELLSFDFYGWLVARKAEGATEIVFDTSKFGPSIWPTEELYRRFDSIIAPGPALLGLPSREGKDGYRGTVGASRLNHLVAAARSSTLPRLRSVLAPRSARYTVTLRQQTRKSPYRNSNEMAWRQFAGEIGALVIEDYDVKPISLHERVALYAGAEMNFGVASGPMFLCTLTPYPCMSFAWGRGIQEVVLTKYGMPRGTNMPWCGSDQFTFWHSDELEIIRRCFAEWKARR
jgi:hypothetical protein